MRDVIPQNDFEETVLDNIDQYGCHINYVFDDVSNAPAFSYSVGFISSVDQPEVIIFGLTDDVMGFAINQIMAFCRDGLSLTDGAVVEGLIDSHKTTLREVHPNWIVEDYFNSAMWYHRARAGSELQRAVQLVWPSSRNGLFPWDKDCAQIVRNSQPALYLPKYDA